MAHIFGNEEEKTLYHSIYNKPLTLNIKPDRSYSIPCSISDQQHPQSRRHSSSECIVFIACNSYAQLHYAQYQRKKPLHLTSASGSRYLYTHPHLPPMPILIYKERPPSPPPPIPAPIYLHSPVTISRQPIFPHPSPCFLVPFSLPATIHHQQSRKIQNIPSPYYTTTPPSSQSHIRHWDSRQSHRRDSSPGRNRSRCISSCRCRSAWCGGIRRCVLRLRLLWLARDRSVLGVRV